MNYQLPFVMVSDGKTYSRALVAEQVSGLKTIPHDGYYHDVRLTRARAGGRQQPPELLHQLQFVTSNEDLVVSHLGSSSHCPEKAATLSRKTCNARSRHIVSSGCQHLAHIKMTAPSSTVVLKLRPAPRREAVFGETPKSAGSMLNMPPFS